MFLRLLQRSFRRGSAARSRGNGETPTAQGLVATAALHAQKGEITHAEALLQEALSLDPSCAAAHDVLGNILRGRDQIEQALVSYERALQLDPLLTTALSNCALCMRDLGRFEEARNCYERAASIDPDNPTIAMNLAALLFDSGQFGEASEKINALLRVHPDFDDARVVRGIRLLRRGDFAAGWADYERRDRSAGRAHPAAFDYPEWDGQPLLCGTLLVCGEQGIGDQIMFASCINDLLRLIPQPIVECDSRLKILFARSFPQARFFIQRSRGDEMWLRDGLVPTVKTWMGSLPSRFRRQSTDFPAASRYLCADANKTAAWRLKLNALGPGLKVGISWRGGTGSTRRALRSIELSEWIPLLRTPPIHFISLQYGNCKDEINHINATNNLSLLHWEAALDDYDETAALVSGLDLVISVQTAVVHLAGALGTPVWVLVPSVPEWRYGESGDRMVWYPSATLYRQTKIREWTDVLVKVQTALVDLAAAKLP